MPLFIWARGGKQYVQHSVEKRRTLSWRAAGYYCLNEQLGWRVWFLTHAVWVLVQALSWLVRAATWCCVYASRDVLPTPILQCSMNNKFNAPIYSNCSNTKVQSFLFLPRLNHKSITFQWSFGQPFYSIRHQIPILSLNKPCIFLTTKNHVPTVLKMTIIFQARR